MIAAKTTGFDMTSSDQDSIDPFDVPPVSPENEPVVTTAGDFASTCAKAVSARPGRVTIVASLVTMSERWGLVWRADITTIHDPAIVEKALAGLRARGHTLPEGFASMPHQSRAVCWQSDRGMIMADYPPEDPPIADFIKSRLN